MVAGLDLKAILAFAQQLALDAGKIIKDGQQRRFETEATEDEKMNSVDLVTEVDKAVQAYIEEKITAQYPDHKFIGEETYTGQDITDEPTWIEYAYCEQGWGHAGADLADNAVDPIDGTTNFIHGYPFCCTSIGLAVGGKPVVGVIYNPFLDQLYSAAQGLGAYLNKTQKLPITGKPKKLASLGQALIGIEYGSKRNSPTLPSKSKTFHTLASDVKEGGKMAHSLRAGGSAACNIALVATGGLDMYWEIGCWPWDVCAGICILEEAGGRCFGGKNTDLSGEHNGELMSGRKYLFMRAIAPAEGETALQTQQRFARELLDTTEDLDPNAR